MSDTPPVMEAKEYQLLLEKLLVEGKGYGRFRNIVAFRKSAHDYLMTNDLSKGLGYLSTGTEPEKGEAAFYLKISSIIDQIYQPEDPAHPDRGVMKPNPDQYHLVLQVPEGVVMPGPSAIDIYAVRPGGYIKIAQKDVAALSQALDDIRHGRVTAEEALYRKVAAFPGKAVAKFDVFGVDGPGIESWDYGPVDLSEKTKVISSHFTRIALPFTRRSANFVADHVAPERASFRKRGRSGLAL